MKEISKKVIENLVLGFFILFSSSMMTVFMFSSLDATTKNSLLGAFLSLFLWNLIKTGKIIQ